MEFLVKNVQLFKLVEFLQFYSLKPILFDPLSQHMLKANFKWARGDNSDVIPMKILIYSLLEGITDPYWDSVITS